MKCFRQIIAIFLMCISVSAVTAVSDYEYLLGKYKTMKKSLDAEKEEKRRIAKEEWLAAHPEAEENQRRLAEEKRVAAEKRKKLEEEALVLAEKKAEIIKNAEHIKSIDAYLIKMPNQNYSMTMTEVTQKQWETVMRENPSKHWGYDLPVENVTFLEAVEFCNALSKKEGLKKCYKIKTEYRWGDRIIDKAFVYNFPGVIKYYNVICNFKANGYRLPTEEEWEYAMKGGENFKYSGSDVFDEVGWNDGITHPVAQKKPNGYGLYDMSGNVYEMDWESKANYDDDFYSDRIPERLFAEDVPVIVYPKSGNLGFRIVRSSSKK